MDNSGSALHHVCLLRLSLAPSIALQERVAIMSFFFRVAGKHPAGKDHSSETNIVTIGASFT